MWHDAEGTVYMCTSTNSTPWIGPRTKTLKSHLFPTSDHNAINQEDGTTTSLQVRRTPSRVSLRFADYQIRRSTRLTKASLKWKLNFDMYDYIMTFLEPHELSMMMRTCHDLYAAGIKHLVNYPHRLS
ncbi:hypothetical protein OBBRIDRAFT_373785 [Obba rivulosa]|uniref:F-box domain-containing protein n=1 Tax=Obba rivulosa TaxID=1052685 RepID=A0A8E2AMU3_9APHY|nr:hypothetical protein OBBRIDRAFT_373785 [Obba rivulosa]